MASSPAAGKAWPSAAGGIIVRADIKLRKRIALTLSILTLLFILVGVRIGSLTLFQGKQLTARGVSQWTREGVVTARRGAIVDRNGDVLAQSTTAYIVSANPQLIEDAQGAARVLAPILNMDEETLAQKMGKKGQALVMLKRQVPREKVDLIRSVRMETEEMQKLLKGISFDEDTRRFYPKGTFLAQVLGLTNVDSQGQSGLESRYETLLKGTEGLLKTEVDAKARLLPDGETVYVPPEEGSTLQLTIDSVIQSVVEKAMRDCMADNNAKGVQCIVMDVNTGAILALCMKPDYDPADPPRNDTQLLNELMRITVITDVYEPGSTFKILTCAAALDSGAVTVNDGFHCTGSILVDGDKIRCWKDSHGAQTLRDALANSCNPAFVNIALRMGTDTMYKYMRSFGLGSRTGIDLPGESAGILINSRLVKNVDLARIGFGQSVAVTPLQLITAASSVVNGGRVMKPYIVDAVLDGEGNVIDKTHPQVVSTPISEETSETMRALLLNVVDNGGGKNAAIPGYLIGGKTGTAQVYKDGRVVSDVHIGSFIGFAPMDEPQIAVLVTVNEARVPVDYGSITAAPFARQIMEEVLPYLGVKKQMPGATQAPGVVVKDVKGMDVQEAKKLLQAQLLVPQVVGSGNTVTYQLPYAGSDCRAGDQVMIYTYDMNVPEAEDMVAVPDVKGLSMVEASRMLRARGLDMVLSGSGLAVKQTPGAGSYAPLGTQVQVQFEFPVIGEEKDAAE